MDLNSSDIVHYSEDLNNEVDGVLYYCFVDPVLLKMETFMLELFRFILVLLHEKFIMNIRLIKIASIDTILQLMM